MNIAAQNIIEVFMLKSWIVDFEINMCAEHHEKVEVKAHTKKKAIKYAKDKITKKQKTNCVILCSCEEII